MPICPVDRFLCALGLPDLHHTLLRPPCVDWSIAPGHPAGRQRALLNTALAAVGTASRPAVGAASRPALDSGQRRHADCRRRAGSRHSGPTVCQQRFYDVGVVPPSQNEVVAHDYRYIPQLADCLLRVLPPSARQQVQTEGAAADAWTAAPAGVRGRTPTLTVHAGTPQRT